MKVQGRSPHLGRARSANRGKRGRVRLCKGLITLCLLAAFAGCGEATQSRDAEAVTACLRESGATVEEGRLYSFPGAAIEGHRVTLKSGGFAGVEVFRSEEDARRRLTTGPVAVRKRETVVLYPGERQDDATLLEGCLRASATGDPLRRGELARLVSQSRARREEAIAKQRNRSYSNPSAITNVLDRLRSYRRYRLYYPGRQVGRLPLTGVASALKPPAYKQATRRIPWPISPGFDFIYGRCKPPPDEGGCGPPLQVQNSEVCAVNPNSLGLSPDALTERIRGVPVLRQDGGRSVTLFTGGTTISISADTSDITARAIADLQPLDGSVAPGANLPPPGRGALEGRLRCKLLTKAELNSAP